MAAADVFSRARASLASARARVMELPAIARSVRAVVALAGSLQFEPLTLRAAALTYLTLLSLVPLLAVVFSVFQAVVGTEELRAQLQHFILQNLAVGVAEEFSQNLTQFVARASAGAIGGVGFAFLVVSSVSLLANVESALNHIFRATGRRPLAVRFGIYWCLLTLGPILLSLSIAGTALLQTSRLLEWMGPARKVLLYVLPVLVTYSAFMLLYLIVPATPVRRKAALIGAVVAGSAWELAKIVYAFVSTLMVRNNAIYGSLSAIPIFLMWAYVSWVLVLFGARIAYAAQTPLQALLDEGAPAEPLRRELSAARLMLLVAQAFEAGRSPPSVRTLGTRSGLGEGAVRALLSELERAGLVRSVSPRGWVPARPLAHIRLRDVRSAVRGAKASQVLDADALGAHWRKAEEAAARELGTSYAELLEAARDGKVPWAPPQPARS